MLTAELAHAGAPLGRSLVVPHPLARGDQVATGPSDAEQEPRLTIERHCRRLVKAAHAFLQLALAHESPPLKPEPEHLELRSPEHPAQLDGARRQPPRLDRVLVQGNRDVSLMDGEPAMIDPRLEAVDEAVRALEPAVGNRRLATKHEAVGGKPGGYPCRGALVPALKVQAVGALPGVESEPVLVQHVANPAHPFERLWGLASAKDSSKEALARSQSPPLRAAQPASSGAARISSSATSPPSKSQAREPRGEETEGRALAPLLHGQTLTPASDYRQARRWCGRVVMRVAGSDRSATARRATGDRSWCGTISSRKCRSFRAALGAVGERMYV